MLAVCLQSRALNGVKQDIVALTEIPHIGASSARRLFNEGLRTAEVIAKASEDVIFNALSKGALSNIPIPEMKRCALVMSAGLPSSNLYNTISGLKGWPALYRPSEGLVSFGVPRLACLHIFM